MRSQIQKIRKIEIKLRKKSLLTERPYGADSFISEENAMKEEIGNCQTVVYLHQ